MKSEAVMKTCLARANTTRSILCLLFPFGALFWYYQRIISFGISIDEYPGTILQNGRNALSFLLVFVGVVAWVAIVWPKAILALRYRTCAIESDGAVLTIYGNSLPLKNIESASIRRRIFGIDLELNIKSKKDAAIYSVVLLSPSPKKILAIVEAVVRSS